MAHKAKRKVTRPDDERRNAIPYHNSAIRVREIVLREVRRMGYCHVKYVAGCPKTQSGRIMAGALWGDPKNSSVFRREYGYNWSWFYTAHHKKTKKTCRLTVQVEYFPPGVGKAWFNGGAAVHDPGGNLDYAVAGLNVELQGKVLKRTLLDLNQDDAEY
jgi:hypothetical protein